jgi:hypothetical protein
MLRRRSFSTDLTDGQLAAVADMVPDAQPGRGVWEHIHQLVLMADCEHAERVASLAAAIIASQSVWIGDQNRAHVVTTRARRSRGGCGTS